MDIDRQTDWRTETRKNSFFYTRRAHKTKRQRQGRKKRQKPLKWKTGTSEGAEDRGRMNETWRWRFVLVVCLRCWDEAWQGWGDGWEVNGWRIEGTVFVFWHTHPFWMYTPPLPQLREHHPTVSDTFQESFKYRRTCHRPRLFRKNRLNFDYKYTEKDTHQDRDSALVRVKAKKRRNPHHHVTTHPSAVSSSTHHRVLGAWWRWGSCSGTPPCVAYSHWCMCYRPCHTEACRCRHTRWDHKSSGRSAVPPDTHHRRDSPCIRLQEKQNNAASLDCTGDNPTLTLP